MDLNSDVLSLDAPPEPELKGEDGELGNGASGGRQSTTTMSSENGTPIAGGSVATPNIKLKFKNPAAMNATGAGRSAAGGSGSSAPSPDSD